MSAHRPGIRVSILLAILACSASCSNGSGGGGGSMCDAATCASIATTIMQNGGGVGTCVEPTPKFENACQAYESCLKQCGQ
jgi:hypothetical protein